MDRMRLKEVMDQATAALEMSHRVNDGGKAIGNELALLGSVGPTNPEREHLEFNDYIQSLGTLPPIRKGSGRYRPPPIIETKPQPSKYGSQFNRDRWEESSFNSGKYNAHRASPASTAAKNASMFPSVNRSSHAKPPSEPRPQFEPEDIKLPRLVPRQDPLPPKRSTEGSPLELTSPRRVVRPLPYSPLSKDLPWVDRSPRDYCPEDLTTKHHGPERFERCTRFSTNRGPFITPTMRKIIQETLDEQWPPYGTRLRRNENLSPRTAYKILEELEEMRNGLISMDHCMPGSGRRNARVYHCESYDGWESEMEINRSPRRCVSMHQQSEPLAICAPPPRRVTSSTGNLQPSLPHERVMRRKKGVPPPEDFYPSQEFKAQLGTIHDNLIALTETMRGKTHSKTTKAKRKPGYED